MRKYCVNLSRTSVTKCFLPRVKFGTFRVPLYIYQSGKCTHIWATSKAAKIKLLTSLQSYHGDQFSVAMKSRKFGASCLAKERVKITATWLLDKDESICGML